MSILRELFVKLGLNVDEASFARGALAAEGMRFGLEKIVEWGAEVAKSLVEVVKGAVETAAHLDDTSQAIGVSTAALQELTYAAGQSGVEAGELEQSFRILSRTMNAAAQGGEEQAKVFSKLGVHLKGSNGKLRDADGVLEDIATKFAKLPNGAEKTALAMQLFGKAGAKMVPLLNEGAEGIERMRQEARDLGIVLDESMIKQGAEIDDLAHALSAMWKGIKTAVGGSLFGDILKVGRAVKAWVIENRKLIQQGLVDFFKGLITVGKIVAEIFFMIGRNAGFLFDGLMTTLGGIWQLLTGLGPLREVLLGLVATFVLLTHPVVALAAALAGLLYFIDDFRMFLKYGNEANTLTGQFLKNVDKWMEPQENDPWWITALKDFLGMIRETLKAMQELDRMINGTKMHEDADKAGARDARDVTRQADATTAMSARNRLAAGKSLTEAEIAALDRLRNSDSSQFFAMPSGDPRAFALNTGAYTASPSIAKSAKQAGAGVSQITVAPQININGNGDTFLEEAIQKTARLIVQDTLDTAIEDASASMGD